MQITGQSDTLIQLTHWNFVNCQLIRENDGFTLIDTGLLGCTEGIIASAKQMGSQTAFIETNDLRSEPSLE